MKKLIATISLLILFISSQAQSPLYINKYLRDSLVGGFWVLYHDTTHTGQFGPLSGGGGGSISLIGENYLSLAGSTLTANAVNLSGTNVTGTLAAARFPALTGDITTSAGSLTTSIAVGAIVNADVNASAAIAYSKLSLTGSILNADLAGSIAASKLIGTDIVTVGTINTGTWQGTAIANAYIASGLDATKIADGSVSNTEYQYINSLASNAQTQLNNKEQAFTQTSERFTGSTSSTVTVSNTPLANKARLVYWNNVLVDATYVSIVGVDFTISIPDLPRQTDTVITVIYSYQ
jgi:hypothetical protein